MGISQDFVDILMNCAIEEAKLAFSEGEVPIGAAIGSWAGEAGTLIARDHNRIEQKHDPTAHAEMLVIRAAAEKAGNWRLSDTVLCVSLEPCLMCAGAIRLARIPLLVFGAADNRFGAFGSGLDLSEDASLGPLPEVRKGLRSEECAGLLKQFFKERR